MVIIHTECDALLFSSFPIFSIIVMQFLDLYIGLATQVI